MYCSDLVGVAIVGRPIARMNNDRFTVEILRVCVKPNSPKGCNSKLFSRCRRIAQTMGYKKIITYTLLTESQSSLKAINAKIDHITKPGVISKSSFIFNYFINHYSNFK